MDDLPSEGGWAGDGGKPGAPFFDLARAMMPLPTLLAEGKKLLRQTRTSETHSAIQDLLERTLNMEAELKDWDASLPPVWQKRTIAYVQDVPTDLMNAEAWIGPIHEYSDIHVSSMINHQRASRICCNCLIMKCLEWLSRGECEQDPQYQRARYDRLQMLDDLCYSIPFHFGWSTRSDAQTQRERLMTKNLGVHGLIWPTSIAVGYAEMPTQQGIWLRGRLRAIVKTHGFQQAMLMQQGMGF